MSGNAPAARIAGWTSTTYTVRVDGKVVAANVRPSTTLAVASHDSTTNTLEIALRTPMDPTQVVEITSAEPLR